MEHDDDLRKLDPQLFFQLAEKSETERIGIIVRVASPLSREQHKALEDLGIRIESEAGPIFTCRATSNAIRDMAQHDWVQSIESGSTDPN